MAKSALLSVRMPEDLTDRLEKLARATERSKSFLAAQAIEEYVAVQDWQVTAIQEGMAAAKPVVGFAAGAAGPIIFETLREQYFFVIKFGFKNKGFLKGEELR